MVKKVQKKGGKKQSKVSVNKQIKKEKKQVKKPADKLKPVQNQKKEKKEEPETKKVNPKKMVYFGRGNMSIKDQMKRVWGSTVKKLMQLSPEDLQKDIKDCEYTPYQKNQIGTMIHGAIKGELQIGVKSDHYIYDEVQLKQYKAAYEKANKMTNKALQEILKKNDQPITDKKEKLVERVADGEVLGQIPRCPICYGGKLKFSNKKGIYMCPGYVDGGDNCVKGDDYIFCNKKFNLKEITRLKWE